MDMFFLCELFIEMNMGGLHHLKAHSLQPLSHRRIKKSRQSTAKIRLYSLNIILKSRRTTAQQA
jgi:hypothetical protein